MTSSSWVSTVTSSLPRPSLGTIIASCAAGTAVWYISREMCKVLKETAKITSDVKTTAEAAKAITERPEISDLIAFVSAETDVPSTFTWDGTYSTVKNIAEIVATARGLLDIPAIHGLLEQHLEQTRIQTDSLRLAASDSDTDSTLG